MRCDGRIVRVAKSFPLHFIPTLFLFLSWDKSVTCAFAVRWANCRAAVKDPLYPESRSRANPKPDMCAESRTLSKDPLYPESRSRSSPKPNTCLPLVSFTTACYMASTMPSAHAARNTCLPLVLSTTACSTTIHGTLCPACPLVSFTTAYRPSPDTTCGPR